MTGPVPRHSPQYELITVSQYLEQAHTKRGHRVLFVYIYIYTYMYTYIYIEREREKERKIEREREIDRQRSDYGLRYSPGMGSMSFGLDRNLDRGSFGFSSEFAALGLYSVRPQKAPNEEQTSKSLRRIEATYVAII